MKAFPSNHDPKTGTMQLGMELRDYFAAKAMQGLCANPNAEPSIGQEVWAKAAYQVADAMLKEREQ